MFSFGLQWVPVIKVKDDSAVSALALPAVIWAQRVANYFRLVVCCGQKLVIFEAQQWTRANFWGV